MTDQTDTLVGALARIGIAITPHAQAAHSWGWSIENAKIIRNWEGTHASSAEAAGAALDWLLEHARKGLLCHHTHPVAVDDDPLAPWLRFFKQWDVAVE